MTKVFEDDLTAEEVELEWLSGLAKCKAAEKMFEVLSESEEVSQVGSEMGMNRAERRRFAKEQRKKPAVYSFTKGQLKEKISKGVFVFKKDLAEDIINKVTNDYIILTLNVLYDGFGFDCEQLKNSNSGLTG